MTIPQLINVIRDGKAGAGSPSGGPRKVASIADALRLSQAALQARSRR